VELTGGAFVFSRCADGATPWLPNWTTKEFIRARRAAGLPQFRLHDLRHFMATEMLAAGVPIVTVSQRLSHARVSTTLNVYAHSVPGGDRRAAETLAAILHPAVWRIAVLLSTLEGCSDICPHGSRGGGVRMFIGWVRRM